MQDRDNKSEKRSKLNDITFYALIGILSLSAIGGMIGIIIWIITG